MKEEMDEEEMDEEEEEQTEEEKEGKRRGRRQRLVPSTRIRPQLFFLFFLFLCLVPRGVSHSPCHQSLEPLHTYTSVARSHRPRSIHTSAKAQVDQIRKRMNDSVGRRRRRRRKRGSRTRGAYKTCHAGAARPTVYSHHIYAP